MYAHHAYLMVGLKLDGTPIPKVYSVEIFSESENSLTQSISGYGVLWCRIATTSGDSFQEARDRMLETIRTTSHLSWTSFWLVAHQEYHLARGAVQGQFTPSLDRKPTPPVQAPPGDPTMSSSYQTLLGKLAEEKLRRS